MMDTLGKMKRVSHQETISWKQKNVPLPQTFQSNSSFNNRIITCRDAIQQEDQNRYTNTEENCEIP